MLISIFWIIQFNLGFLYQWPCIFNFSTGGWKLNYEISIWWKTPEVFMYHYSCHTPVQVTNRNWFLTSHTSLVILLKMWALPCCLFYVLSVWWQIIENQHTTITSSKERKSLHIKNYDRNLYDLWTLIIRTKILKISQ